MTAHPLIGKVVRWSHGQNVLVGPATRYDDDDDELFIVPDGLMHGHYWVPAAECVDASVLAEQGEPEWEIGYQLIDQWGNSVGVGWPFPTVEEAAEQGERRASEETARDPRFATWSRVARRRKAGPWLPVEENTPTRTVRSGDE